MVGFGPGMKTAAETAGHTHQVVVVQILIGSIQLPPPHAKTSSCLPQGEIGVADHPIDAVISTLQELAV
jgi:hypothetical protein